MSSLPILFSSMLTISVAKKAASNQHAKINGHGRRTVRIPVHSTPRTVFKPSAAMMMDGTSSNSVKNEVRQPITSYAPTMWGDVFSTFSLDDEVQQKYSEEIEVLKKEARSMLIAATSTTLLILIDKLERLGLAYHFETEIEDKLKEVYDSAEKEDETNYDLFTTALRFRLLRQHQFHVSCTDAFAKFVDKDNKLKENLSDDVEGLLSLYEAAYVRIHDEKVLEEAVAFTTHHLSRMLPQLESPLKVKQVQQALQFPLQRIPTIIFVHSYIDNYENENSRDEVLLRLAKLNFNFMQNIFRNELYQITRWWNELNMPLKIPYFRDRLVENYMWCLAHTFEPHYPVIRIVMTKLYILITIMDDTYDNYCTLSEIELLTRAIERWNAEESDLLPEYLKLVYKLIMSVNEEIEREAEKLGNSYIVPNFVEAIKQLGRSYALEQKWIMEKQMPSFEERMMNSRVTTLNYVSFSTVVALMESGTKETIDWVLSDPEILIASSDIVRLNNDLVTFQRENKDGTLQTCIDYYMKDNGLSSVQEAEFEFKEIIEDRWKDLNASWVECKQHTVPKEIIVQFMDIARMCAIIYMNDLDNFTYPEKNNMTPTMTALFLDSTLV